MRSLISLFIALMLPLAASAQFGLDERLALAKDHGWRRIDSLASFNAPLPAFGEGDCLPGSYHLGLRLWIDGEFAKVKPEWHIEVAIGLFEMGAAVPVPGTDTLSIRISGSPQVPIAQWVHDGYPQGIACNDAKKYEWRILRLAHEGEFPKNDIFLSQLYYRVDRIPLSEQMPSIQIETDTAGFVHAYWEYVEGAQEYDLEYTFIDDIDAEDFASFMQEHAARWTAEEMPFRYMEPVRISTPLQYFTTEGVYPKGRLYARVRGAAAHIEKEGLRMHGEWAYAPNPALLEGFQPDLFWQGVATFAEGGKHKRTVGYYDASLRNRQTATQLSTDGNTLVAETLYDFEGRASASVLPAPDASGTLRYRNGFNIFEENAALGSAGLDLLSPAHYDNGKELPDSRLSSASGAARYYSPENNVQGNHRDYIPNARGYAYSLVRYDGQGRPAEQSGLGEAFSMEGGHTTRIYYATPSQTELVRLFGTNVGNASHYRKTVTVDPNGQASVQYADQEGRAIATALMGPSPEGLDALEGTEQVYTTHSLNTSNVDGAEGRSRSVEHTIINVVPTDYEFKYAFSAAAAIAADLCLECRYELSISITDPKGALVALDGIDAQHDEDLTLAYRRTFGQEDCLSERDTLRFSARFTQEGVYVLRKRIALLSGDFVGVRNTIDSLFASERDAIANTNTALDSAQCDICLSCDSVMLADDDGNAVLFDGAAFGEEAVQQLPCSDILDSIKVSIEAEMLAKDSTLERYDPTDEEIRNHPRYCEYEFCQRLIPSKKYERDMQEVGRWSTALQKGMANPIGMDGAPEALQLDPFFQADSLGKPYLKAMADSLNRSVLYDSLGKEASKGTIWQISDPQYNRAMFMGISADQADSLRWNIFSQVYFEKRRNLSLKMAAEKYADCPGVADQLRQPQGMDLASLDSIGGQQAGNAGGRLASASMLASTGLGGISQLLPTPQGIAGLTVQRMLDGCPQPMPAADSTQLLGLITEYFVAKGFDLYANINQEDLGSEPLLTANAILRDNGCTPLDSIAWPDPSRCIDSTLMLIPKLRPQGWGIAFDGEGNVKAKEKTDAFDLGTAISASSESQLVFGWGDSGDEGSDGESPIRPLVSLSLSVNMGGNGQAKANFSSGTDEGGENSNSPFMPLLSRRDSKGRGVSFWTSKGSRSAGRADRVMAIADNDTAMLALPAWLWDGACHGLALAIGMDASGSLAFSATVDGERAGSTAFALVPKDARELPGGTLLYIGYDGFSGAGLQGRIDWASLASTSLAGDTLAIARWEMEEGQGTDISDIYGNIPLSIEHLCPKDGAPQPENPCIGPDWAASRCATLASQPNASAKGLRFDGKAFASVAISDEWAFEIPLQSTPANSTQVLPSALEDVTSSLRFTSSIQVNKRGIETIMPILSRWNSTGIGYTFGVAEKGENGSIVAIIHYDTLYIESPIPVFDGICHAIEIETWTETSPNGSYDQPFSVKFSIDGILIEEKNYTRPTTRGSEQFSKDKVYVGHDAYRHSYLNGTVDYIRLEYNGGGTWGVPEIIWQMDEGQGLVLHDSGGGGYDASLSEANPPVWVDACVQQALYFDGNDYASASGLPDEAMPMPAPAPDGSSCADSVLLHFTASANFQSAVPALAEPAPLFALQGSGGNGISLGIAPSGRPYAYVNGLPLGDACADCNTSLLAVNALDGRCHSLSLELWHHAGGIMAWLYIDGLLAAERLLPPAAAQSGGYAMTAGHDPARGGFFKGSVWGISLSSGQPQGNAYTASWPLSEGTGTSFASAQDGLPALAPGFCSNGSKGRCEAPQWRRLDCQNPYGLPASVPLSDSLELASRLYYDSLWLCTELAGEAFYDSIFLQPSPDSLERLYRAQCLANLAEERKVYQAKEAILFIDSLAASYSLDFAPTCMDGLREDFSYTALAAEYQYTLYYYDQAGSLVRTVPPQGVKSLTSVQANDLIERVKAMGYSAVGNGSNPRHEMATSYSYNSLGQPVAQYTPDAHGSQFYYDGISRLRISQNAQQLADGNCSYTRHDALGRVVEVGQLALGGLAVESLLQEIDDIAFPQADRHALSQQTITHYDNADGAPAIEGFRQENLRGRVAWTEVLEGTGGSGTAPAAITLYDYDIHGNVRRLMQRHAFDREVRYQYDLVSGNVNYVAYQHGKAGQFMHRYTYDADNRIVRVETSRDGYIWDTDARYKYYAHGPLARTELGHYRVQGSDYAYTLQGWIKGVNLPASEAMQEPGRDGTAMSSKDAYAYTLGYYQGDYQPIAAQYEASMPIGDGLYNGNISWMATDIQGLGAQGMAYKYDQLHRIKEAKAYLKGNSGLWEAAGDRHRTAYTYDRNGNIMSLQRHGLSGEVADRLAYNYLSEAGRPTNKLGHVDDLADAGTGGQRPAPAYGMNDQSAGNYEYDQIGNLTKDESEGIARIEWTVYGKVKAVHKQDGSSVHYRYDAAGNRIAKLLMQPNAQGYVKQEYYFRDASGNVMEIYSLNLKDTLDEHKEYPIYGSTRLGTYREDLVHYPSYPTRRLGQKQYEPGSQPCAARAGQHPSRNYGMEAVGRPSKMHPIRKRRFLRPPQSHVPLKKDALAGGRHWPKKRLSQAPEPQPASMPGARVFQAPMPGVAECHAPRLRIAVPARGPAVFDGAAQLLAEQPHEAVQPALRQPQRRGQLMGAGGVAIPYQCVN